LTNQPLHCVWGKKRGRSENIRRENGFPPSVSLESAGKYGVNHGFLEFNFFIFFLKS
jgi:hypothetical protein